MGLTPQFFSALVIAFVVIAGLLCYGVVWFLFDPSNQPARDRVVALLPAPPTPPPVVKPPPTVQARLEDAFGLVYSAWEMARSRAADDPFMRAIDAYRDPKNNFVLRFAFVTTPHGSPVELAVVCARPPGDVTWVVDIRQLTMLAGELSVTIFAEEGAQPSEVRLGGGVRVFALTNAESATSHVLTARVRELSRPSGPEERIEFAHPGVERAKPACDLQRQILGTR